MDTSDNRLHKSSYAFGPVLQFALFLAPIVMTGFFAIYALTGLILEGRDLLNWSLEARAVSLWVTAGMVLFAAFVLLLVKVLGRPSAGTFWRQPLVLSSLAHLLIALALTVLVFART